MEKNLKEKTCENCGVAFGCGSSSSEPCWCMSYEISEVELNELRIQYNNCLCEKCLIEIAKAKKK